jgi:hypothetical protein
MAMFGYHKRRARKKPFLSAKHWQVRLAWARERQDWTIQQWKRVIWTDECSFEVDHDGSQTWVWRKVGEQFLDACLKPTFKSGRTSVMFWGAIGYDMRGPCAVLDTGRITGIKYRDEVLAKHLQPFRNQFRLKHCGGLEPWIVEDRAPCHTANVTRVYLEENKMRRMKWPANSPPRVSLRDAFHFLLNPAVHTDVARSIHESTVKAGKDQPAYVAMLEWS